MKRSQQCRLPGCYEPAWVEVRRYAFMLSEPPVVIDERDRRYPYMCMSHAVENLAQTIPVFTPPLTRKPGITIYRLLTDERRTP